jgi:hypothetical protein
MGRPRLSMTRADPCTLPQQKSGGALVGAAVLVLMDDPWVATLRRWGKAAWWWGTCHLNPGTGATRNPRAPQTAV